MKRSMTGDVSLVGAGLDLRAVKMLTLALVFSAPKYCDMTENKGAYINIGPDYKLDFKKFDAVPHPNIRPMVSIPADPVVLRQEALLT
jgi:hypothetical protein